MMEKRKEYVVQGLHINLPSDGSEKFVDICDGALDMGAAGINLEKAKCTTGFHVFRIVERTITERVVRNELRNREDG